jgi:hypothetical protein
MITADDFIEYKSRATVEQAIVGLNSILGFVPVGAKEFLTFLGQYCNEVGLDFACVASHAANECDYFQDDRFKNRHDAFGIGKTGPGVEGAFFDNYDDAAFFAVVEYMQKLRMSISNDWRLKARSINPNKFDRVANLINSGEFPIVKRIKDLNQHFGNDDCVWMCDENGPNAIIQKGRAIFPNLPNQTNVTPFFEFSTLIPGLPGGPLETDYRIIVDLIPFSEKHRPGRKAKTPRRSVQHGNGNPSSTAKGERNFLHAGAPNDRGVQQTLSYHATADDTVLYVLVPLDEVTYQAADGSGPGNENGYSCEMVEDRVLWGNTSRAKQVVHVCADFMGRVAARLDVIKPEGHVDFNWVLCCDSPCNVFCSGRHNCPDMLRHRTIEGISAWTRYVNEWNDAKSDELDRMSGDIPIPPPIPKPVKLPKGMSINLAKRLFNPNDIRKPGGGKIGFNLSGRVSQAWLVNALSTIPEGKPWTEGDWDGLDTVILRGDGRIVYSFGNFTYEEPAPSQVSSGETFG